MTTLSTTSLTANVLVNDSEIQVASTSGLMPGVQLYVDRELMSVLRMGLGLSVCVLRGQGGTATTAHPSSSTVTIGRADQFQTQDPIGTPEASQVTPWINVITGVQWTAQGDITGPSASAQWWAPMQTTRGVGALGVRTAVSAPSVVTNS